MEIDLGSVPRIVNKAVKPTLLGCLLHDPDHTSCFHLWGRVLLDHAATQPHTLLELALGRSKSILKRHCKFFMSGRRMKPRGLAVDHEIAPSRNRQLDPDMIFAPDPLVPVRRVDEHPAADEARLHPLEL